MSPLGIIPSTNPLLRAPCEPVTDFDAFAEIAARLYGACRDDGRQGVAAPQIGVSLRAFAVKLGDSPYPRVICNPTITNRWGTKLGQEGCLSIDGALYEIARSALVNVSAFDKHGKPIELVLSGFDARALQHECDHLDGILVSDRAAELTAWRGAA